MQRRCELRNERESKKWLKAGRKHNQMHEKEESECSLDEEEGTVTIMGLNKLPSLLNSC